MEYLLQNDEASALVSPDLCCIKASSTFFAMQKLKPPAGGKEAPVLDTGYSATAGLVGPLRTATWLGSAEKR